jgi:competence protein ComGC
LSGATGLGILLGIFLVLLIIAIICICNESSKAKKRAEEAAKHDIENQKTAKILPKMNTKTPGLQTAGSPPSLQIKIDKGAAVEESSKVSKASSLIEVKRDSSVINDEVKKAEPAVIADAVASSAALASKSFFSFFFFFSC